MDLFIAGCQGLGLALAVGALLGAPALKDTPGTVALIAAAIVGAFLFGASLTPEDHPAWPGWIVGAPVAALAYSVSNSVSSGARARAGSEATGITIYIGLFAVALAAICLLPISPISILVLIGFIVLALAQRRRASRKHAGLRSLR
jgi:hypothetical protein